MHPTFIQIPFQFLTGFLWVYFAVAQKNQIITFGSFSFPFTPFLSTSTFPVFLFCLRMVLTDPKRHIV